MSPSTRRILITCLALLLAACVCLSALVLSGAGLAVWSSLHPTSPTQPTPTQTPAFLQIPSATPKPPGAPAPGETLTLAPTPTDLPVSADVAHQMDVIQTQVEAIRGLKLRQPVARALLSPQELRARVLSDLIKDYTPEDARTDETTLAAFGLLPPDFDLITFYQKLYTEQVAGFYDDKTKEMYVVEGEGFNGPERVTYAHEFTHALQDQTFDLRNGLNYSQEACKHQTERCAAIQALVEGDATLVEQEWLLTDSTPLDKQQIQQFYQNYSSPVYDAAPLFMQKDFLFPYTQGLEFVQSLFDQGGWNAVNAAFKNPPVSTEQILHPGLYPDDRPVTVSLPDLSTALGSAWHKVDDGVLGEWYTYLTLADGELARARLPDSVARPAAAGWGGDAYAVYRDDSSGGVGLVLFTQWDTQKDAAEFADAFAQYGRGRWGQQTDTNADHLRWNTAGAYVAFDRQGQSTYWVQGPGLEPVQAILNTLSLP